MLKIQHPLFFTVLVCRSISVVLSPLDVARNDIFGLKWRYYGPKGGILDYLGTLIFFNYPIISYQKMEVYMVERKDMGRFCWYNCVGEK